MLSMQPRAQTSNLRGTGVGLLRPGLGEGGVM